MGLLPVTLPLKITTEYNALKIYFGEILHLKIAQDRIIGFQSWIMGSTYCIEYSLVGGGSILTEYDDPEKWKTILKALDEVTIWRTVL